MTSLSHSSRIARALSRLVQASIPIGLAATVPAAAQSALETATVSIPDANRKPSTDITVVTERSGSGFVIRVTNTGPEPISGVLVFDMAAKNQSCRSANPVAVSAPGTASNAASVARLGDQGIALGLLNSGQTATLTFSC